MNLRKQGQAARARHDRNATHKQVATDMRMLRKLKRKVHTLTADNGREFASHRYS